jgi:hypothetical protein
MSSNFSNSDGTGKLIADGFETPAGLVAMLGAAGYKIARGETALDGTNPTPAATGLTTIVAAAVSLKGTAAPGVGTSVVTYGTSSGTLNLYGWMPTATGDCTLIASTGTETVGWVAVGT